MKLSMRHRILIGTSIAMSIMLLAILSIDITDSRQAIAGHKKDTTTTRTITTPVKTETSIMVKPPYPNPFNGFFHYDFYSSIPVNAELSVINSEGKEIKNIRVNAVIGNNTINVFNDCNMKAGTYYTILKSNNKKYVQRIEKN